MRISPSQVEKVFELYGQICAVFGLTLPNRFNPPSESHKSFDGERIAAHVRVKLRVPIFCSRFGK